MLPPIRARPKLPSDAQLGRLQDQFREEGAAYVCLSGIKTFEHPTFAQVLDRRRTTGTFPDNGLALSEQDRALNV
jgi:hypothetical protein